MHMIQKLLCPEHRDLDIIDRLSHQQNILIPSIELIEERNRTYL